MKIKILSDSTCDLPQSVLDEHNIHLFPLTIIKNSENFLDNVTITPDDIFSHVAAGGDLCTTAAGNAAEYQAFFAKYANDYDGIIHINIGSSFSCSYQNASIAAMEFDNVVTIDSQNLTCGQGLLVLKAVELAQKCTSLSALKTEIESYIPKIETSFVLEQLKYMVKGGRCSSASALGANLLNLKPCIEIQNGKMGVVKKYRGSFAKCLTNYIKDRLENRVDLDNSTIFVVYTPISDNDLMAVRDALSQYCNFDRIVECKAGCTVSCHCGPGTLGILFLNK